MGTRLQTKRKERLHLKKKRRHKSSSTTKASSRVSPEEILKLTNMLLGSENGATQSLTTKSKNEIKENTRSKSESSYYESATESENEKPVGQEKKAIDGNIVYPPNEF